MRSNEAREKDETKTDYRLLKFREDHNEGMDELTRDLKKGTDHRLLTTISEGMNMISVRDVKNKAKSMKTIDEGMNMISARDVKSKENYRSLTTNQ